MGEGLGLRSRTGAVIMAAGAGGPSTAPGCCTQAEGTPGSATSPRSGTLAHQEPPLALSLVPVPDPCQDQPEPCLSCSWGPELSSLPLLPVPQTGASPQGVVG